MLQSELKLKCVSYDGMIFEDAGNFPPHFLLKIKSFERDLDFLELSKVCVKDFEVIPLEESSTFCFPSSKEEVSEAVSESLQELDSFTHTGKMLKWAAKLSNHNIRLEFDANRELVIRLDETISFVFKDLLFEKDTGNLVSWNTELRTGSRLPENFNSISRAILEIILEEGVSNR